MFARPAWTSIGKPTDSVTVGSCAAARWRCGRPDARGGLLAGDSPRHRPGPVAVQRVAGPHLEHPSVDVDLKPPSMHIDEHVTTAKRERGLAARARLARESNDS